MEWDFLSNREEINIAIRKGIAGVNAGRTRPADDVMAELRTKYDITE